MGIQVPQFSLGGGEVSEALSARMDLDRYRTMLRTCRNFIVQKQGGVANRPGLKLVAPQGQESRVGRLLPFVFSETQSYAVLFEHLAIRFYSLGGVVESSPGTTYQIASPFTEDELAALSFDQSGDVMFLAHSAHPPQELRRLGHANWTIGPIPFVPGIAAPTGLTHVSVGGNPTGAPAGTAEKEWDYVVTANDDATGEESVASAVLTPSGKQPLSTDPVKIDWNPVAGSTRYSVYRGKSGIHGFIGDSKKLEGLKYTFTDYNVAPDYTDTPPTGINPFGSAGNYPSVVRLVKQRLCFAATDNDPEKIWMSQTSNFRNFGASSPSKASDTVIFVPALRRVNRVLSLVDLNTMFVLSAGVVVEVTGGGPDAPITPSDVDIQKRAEHGAAALQPLVIGEEAIYAQAKGKAVRDLHYSFEANARVSDDLSILSEHLFTGRSVREWCFARDPMSCVWAVMSDGALLGMTYVREHQVFGWHRHDTDGELESICSVPEGDEDAVYVLARRTVNGTVRRFVERFASREIADVRDGVFLDSAVTYDGRNTGPTRLKFGTSLSWDVDDEALIQADADAFLPGDVGARVIFSGIPLTILLVSNPRLLTVRVEEPVPEDLRSLQTTDWSIARTMFTTGLTHLEGKTVGILADGNTHPQRTVSGGTVTLQRHASVVHVGLPYLSEIETMDLEFPDRSVQGLQKAVSRAHVRVQATRGLWAGTSRPGADETMDEYPQRTVEQGFGTITPESDLWEVPTRSSWNLSGRVILQQRDPLPCRILGIIPDVAVGG